MYLLFCSLSFSAFLLSITILPTPTRRKPLIAINHAINWTSTIQFSSVTWSCPTLGDPMQHARPPCSSPTPRVYSNSCLLSWWCHPIISSSVISFSCLQSFPASGSFQMSQLFASGGQSTGVSASTSVLAMNTQDCLDLLAVQGSLKSLFQEDSVSQNKLNLQFWGWPPGGDMCIWYSLSALSIIFWRQRINVFVFFTFLQF